MGVHEAVQGFFPYSEVRPSQDDLMNFIYESLSSGNSAIAEGANGLGKTIAVLSSILPLLKEGGYKVLYCARTHGQMDRVIEELKLIAKKSRVSGISIRGRAEMCVHKLLANRAASPREAMEVCRQLRLDEKCPYYENIEKKYDVCDGLQRQISSTPHTISEIFGMCKREEICPYEFVKLVLDRADVIALSYIYLLNELVRESFVSNFTKPLSEFIVVFDEAHNLPSIASEVASRRLSRFTIKQAERESTKYGYDEIALFCKRLSQVVDGEEFDGERQISPMDFVDRLGVEGRLDFFNHLVDVGRGIVRRRLSDGKYRRSYMRFVGEFLLRWIETANDDDYIHLLSDYETVTGVLSRRLEIQALAPDKIIAPVLRSVHRTVHVSATIEPLEAYRGIVGLLSDTPYVALPSPFPREHILTLICKGVRTDLGHRTPTMYRKLARRTAETIRYTPANVGVFTASYEVLDGLLSAGLADMSDKRILSERRGTSSKENDALVRRFKSYADKGGAVLLGVQGGRNAEGRDYPSNLMNTVVVVGVPYAKPLPRTRAQEEYYEKAFPGHGREYGYVIPALKRAAQAAGRPIRSLEDVGVCVFLDYRFSTFYLKRHLPHWLRRNLMVVPDEEGGIAKELILFYGFRK